MLLSIVASTVTSYAQSYKDAFDNFEQSYYSGNGLSNHDNLTGSLGWGASYEKMAFMKMYRSTGQLYYLGRLVDRTVNVLAQRDDNAGRVDYLNRSRATWVATKYSNDDPKSPYAWVVHSGMITYPIADFVQTVYNNPAIHGYPHTAGGTTKTLKQWADDFYVEVNATISAHSAQWISNHYRTEAAAPVSNAGQVLPYNMSAAMGRTLLMMYLADPAANASYLTMVTIMASQFKAALNYDSGTDSYYWNYSIYSGMEDISHALIECDFARLCYEEGIQFNQTHMKRFANTFRRIYKEPLYFNRHVDGGDGGQNVMTVSSSSYPSSLNNGIVPTALQTQFADSGQSLGNNYSFTSIISNSSWELYRPENYRRFRIEDVSPFNNDLKVTGFNYYIFSASQWVMFSEWDRDIYHICADVFADHALYTSSLGSIYLLGMANMHYYKKILDPVALYRGLGGDSELAASACGDFDNDGIDELVLFRNFDGNIYMYELNSNNEFTSVTSYTGFGSNSDWAAVAAGDFDPSHPGDEFVAVRNFDAKIFLFGLVAGQISTIATYSSFGPASQWAGIAGGDFDLTKPGDEFVAVRNFDGNFYLMDYNGSSIVSISSYTGAGSGSQWAGIAAADFDNVASNGDEFVAVRNYDGNFYMYRYQGGSITSVASNTAPGGNSNWVDITAGDYDADGKDEFIAHRNYDGDFYFYKLENGNIQYVNREYHPQNTKKGPLASGRMRSSSPNSDDLFVGRNFDGDLYVYDIKDVKKNWEELSCEVKDFALVADIGNDPIHWQDEEYAITGDFRIPNGGDVTITGANIKMDANASITIEQGGTLTLNDVTISTCDGSYWKGIEVWGDPMSSQQASIQGALNLASSNINNAEIAILAGKRNADGSINNGYGGAIININSSAFSQNVKDVYFTDYTFESTASRITGNTFDANNIALSREGTRINLNIYNIEGLQVNDCLFSGGDLSINLENVTDFSITSSQFKGVSEAIKGIDLSNLLVNNIEVEDVGGGVLLNNVAAVSVSNSTITNAQFGLNFNDVNDVNILGNSITQSAVGLKASSLSDWDIRASNMTGVSQAVVLENCNNGNANFSDNTIANAAIALTMSNSNLANMSFNCNQLTDFTEYGILTHGTTTLGDWGTPSIGSGNDFISASTNRNNAISYSGVPINWYYDPSLTNSALSAKISNSVNRSIASADAACIAAPSKRLGGTDEKRVEKSHSLEIFPNPTQNFVTIRWSEIPSERQGVVTLIDQLGKQVLRQNAKENFNKLDIGHLPSGIYFIKIQYGDKIELSKLIKHNSNLR